MTPRPKSKGPGSGLPPTPAKESAQGPDGKPSGQGGKNEVISSKDLPGGTDPFQNIPLPSIADEEEPHLLGIKTLLE